MAENDADIHGASVTPWGCAVQPEDIVRDGGSLMTMGDTKPRKRRCHRERSSRDVRRL